jgi:hypothetical protein
MRPYRALLLLLIPFLLCACSPVKPWQKGNLAKPYMAIDPDPLEARFNRHIEESREGSRGGYGVAAGGCGCG